MLAKLYCDWKPSADYDVCSHSPVVDEREASENRFFLGKRNPLFVNELDDDFEAPRAAEWVVPF